LLNRDRSFYQYALLNLAVLEADFGSYQEAVTTMQEAVSVARENKDMGCLNFSLSWLYHFGKAHPKVVTNEADKTNMLGVEREGLVFLRTKAKESGMWNLWSAALLTEAKAGLANGESIATAFENILRSSELSVTKNMMNNVGAQMMLQSSLWSRLGVTSLALSYCEVFLRCHAKAAPFDDVLKFTCRTAYLWAEKGHYDKAMEILAGLNTDSLRPLKANQYWSTFRGILRLKRDLHRNDLDGADQLLGQLLQCRGDPDLSFEVNRLHIDAMMRGGDYQGALTKIETLAAEQKEDAEDIYFHVKLLIMKALLFDKCGRPQKGFSTAVRAAAIAWRARLLSPLWEAMGAIANILTSLGEFEASSQILASITPRALEYEDCALNAQLYSFLADAHMGIAGMAERDSMKQTENLTNALDFVDRALVEYSCIEDIKGQCDMVAKKATVLRLVGDVVLANEYAATYLSLNGKVFRAVT